jgi:Cu(I)/Ag(I) efflux system membrane fusion protein
MKFLPFFLTLLLVSLTVWGAEERYTCPMHPSFISDSPGSCPICGMDLVLISEGTNSNGDESGLVTIPSKTIQNMGVRTERAIFAPFGRSVHAYGLLAENTRLKEVVSSRVSGWIEQLEVSAVGDIVKKGDLLLRLYSPELVAAQRDFLAALKSGDNDTIVVTSARLKSLGLESRMINEISHLQKIYTTIPVNAPRSGVVSQLMVVEGAYLKPGISLLTVQDYSSIWVEVNVALRDLPFVQEGDIATVTTERLSKATPNSYKAEVAYIYPTVDVKNRTGRIRLVLSNADGVLRPGMYVDVEIETEAKERLSVPSEAILKGRDGDHLIIALGEGQFKPRRVTTGFYSNGRLEIIDGLESGENVVTSSQFLIDSESQLRAALQNFEAPGSKLESEQMGGGHGSHNN